MQRIYRTLVGDAVGDVPLFAARLYSAEQRCS